MSYQEDRRNILSQYGLFYKGQQKPKKEILDYSKIFMLPLRKIKNGDNAKTYFCNEEDILHGSFESTVRIYEEMCDYYKTSKDFSIERNSGMIEFTVFGKALKNYRKTLNGNKKALK